MSKPPQPNKTNIPLERCYTSNSMFCDNTVSTTTKNRNSIPRHSKRLPPRALWIEWSTKKKQFIVDPTKNHRAYKSYGEWIGARSTASRHHMGDVDKTDDNVTPHSHIQLPVSRSVHAWRCEQLCVVTNSHCSDLRKSTSRRFNTCIYRCQLTNVTRKKKNGCLSFSSKFQNSYKQLDHFRGTGIKHL